jgi:sulfate transport system substrate-binding protein
LAVVAALFLLIPAGGCGGQEADITLVNVSYDPTRELYVDLNKAFEADYMEQTGKSISVTQAHGGSGAQARAVIDGQPADVVTLALAGDIDAIARKGLLAQDWQSRLPDHSSPYTSTIVFVVREGNPRNIKDWPDLVRPDVEVVTPNPKTSGGARWNFLAAWGYVTLDRKQGDDAATEFVTRLYKNVKKLDTGARGSTETFVRRKMGDVFISWENEALLAQKENPGAKLQIVYPSVSILAEPPVAVVDKVVDARGTRDAAEAYLKFHYTDAAQDIIGEHGYRPSSPAHQKKYAATLPPIRTFTIRDVAGTWAQAQQRFFADGGVFDTIYQPRGGR